jgi:hypothetical protein
MFSVEIRSLTAVVGVSRTGNEQKNLEHRLAGRRV